VVKLAFPLLSVRVPNTVVPSLNVALPVGMPEVEDFTVAVNVTDRPWVEGFFELITDVEVGALFTVCDTAADVLPARGRAA
jgi:hypothetical protein